jgi:myosin V
MDDANAKATKVMIATLQKFGYDLEDVGLTASEDRDSTASSSGSRSSGSSMDQPRDSGTQSSSILQLRERKNNQTALHIAVKKGHMDVLRALGKLPCVGDFVNLGDRHANTALHFAASSTKECAVEMVEFLFSIGASAHAVNVRGQTPLMIHILTVKEDNAAITRLFVKKGLMLNELVNGASTTFLHMAVERNLLEIASALVAGGASINIPDTNGAMVSDLLPRKALVKLVCVMQEGTQTPPRSVPRNCCKICKAPKGLLETYRDCSLCGRIVCKNCSKKASEIKTVHDGSSVSVTTKEKDPGRLCNVCSTVVLLRDKKHKAQEDFNQRLFGGGAN